MIKNNLQAEIEDKEQEIIIKSMNYDAYHENIYFANYAIPVCINITKIKT